MSIRIRQAVLGTAIVMLMAGCGGSQPATSSMSAPESTAAAAASDCRPLEPFSGTDDHGGPQVQDIALAVPLPAGISVITGRVSTDSDSPGMFAIAIDLCGGTITSADELRPVATAFAKAYKAAPFADQIFALYVANYLTFTKTGTSGEVKLKDGEFKLHLWNGNPSPEAELDRWEVVVGS